MKTGVKAKVLLLAAGVLALGSVGSAFQVRDLLKILGIGAVVQKFGPEMNKAINSLASHSDSRAATTKVVPIISVGSRQAIGAAQVMGERSRVNSVTAVAQLDQNIFGNEVKIRAMVPVSSRNLDNLRKVEGVGISGIIDLKL